MMGNEDEDGTIRSKRLKGPSREKRGKNLAKSELGWPQREVFGCMAPFLKARPAPAAPLRFKRNLRKGMRRKVHVKE